jgi:hypothetical protein
MGRGVLTLTDMTAFKVVSKSVAAFHKGIRGGMLHVAPIIVNTVRTGILNPPKTGRLYFLNGKLHQASAPGEYPAELTGALREGVQYRVHTFRELVVGDTVSYGEVLEEGGISDQGFKVEARPHLQPAALSKAGLLGSSIGLGIREALKV